MNNAVQEDSSNTWFLTLRTVERDYSFCCMSKPQALQTMLEEVARRAGDVLEAELRTPDGVVEKLPLT